MEVYNKYSTHLKEKYGEKVYKIPINLPVTCPNRDGTVGTGGCNFCAEIGTGYEMQLASKSISQQFIENSTYISQRYKAKRFIVYFQNYSNTYLPLEQLEAYLLECIHDSIVGIAISTRPDCIHDTYLEKIAAWGQKYKKDVCIELGLQTVHYHLLEQVNRGHGLAEYIDAVRRIQSYGLEVCTHLILNLPGDTMLDTIENAKCMSALQIDYVKLHSLYIAKGTKMAKEYEKGNLTLISLEEYKERVITFLRYLAPEVVMQRLIGRAPEAYTICANWNTSWWKIHDEIVVGMEKNNYKQGDLCNYLNGRAIKKFLS